MGIEQYLAQLIKSELCGGVAEQIPEGVSFEMLIDIAKRNHLSYMVFSALMKTGSLTEEQCSFCRGEIFRAILLSSAQKDELKKIFNKFEDEEIENQPMKGSILKYLYPNTEMREMSDIDILIKASSFDKAKNIFKEMGYELYCDIKHHDIYTKEPFLVIEAHRAMYDKNVDKTQSEYFTGFDKAKIKEGCKYTYEFSVEDFYVYMVAHAAKHFYEMGCGIRNLVDIYVYRKKYGDEMNQNYLDSEFSYCGLSSFVNHMEKLAFDWLDGRNEIETGFYKDLFEYMCDSGTYGKDANGIWNKFADEDAEEANPEHLKLWYYFPPVSYMKKYYPWLENRRGLLPVAWIMRGFRGIFLQKGKKKREMIAYISENEVAKYQRIYRNMQLKFNR